MTTIEQSCPLCGADAEFAWVDHKNRKDFNCPKCTRYEISIAAERRLFEGPEQRRASYSENAALAQPDYRYVITVPVIPPGSQKQSVLSGEYVHVNNLPR